MSNGNTNIVHMAAAEGLAGQIGEQLGKLDEEKPEQKSEKYKALERLAEFETKLLKTRKVFE